MRLGDTDGTSADDVRAAGPLAEPPIDLCALRDDDELVEALAAGLSAPATPVAPGRDPDIEAELVAMLAAWVAEVRPEGTRSASPAVFATATLAAGHDAGVAATGHLATGDRSGDEPAHRPVADELTARRGGRHRSPAPTIVRRLAVAAAFVVVVSSGVTIGASRAVPGEPLWGISTVVFADRARSVEAAADVTSVLATARTALSEGRTVDAARAIAIVRARLVDVRDAEGHDQLDSQQAELLGHLAAVDPAAACLAITPVVPSSNSSTGPGRVTIEPGAGDARPTVVAEGGLSGTGSVGAAPTFSPASGSIRGGDDGSNAADPQPTSARAPEPVVIPTPPVAVGSGIGGGSIGGSGSPGGTSGSAGASSSSGGISTSTPPGAGPSFDHNIGPLTGGGSIGAGSIGGGSTTTAGPTPQVPPDLIPSIPVLTPGPTPTPVPTPVVELPAEATTAGTTDDSSPTSAGPSVPDGFPSGPVVEAGGSLDAPAEGPVSSGLDLLLGG